ncbi:MAG: hypothetical protein CMP16_00985 [Rickettsiales bacterium]|nr:hypothetical protein [Rickettsiales bacterium]|tara:strand:+ start:520 stop:1233 length:714 start_codon:yes stop_codon:yes gene_type:complete
MLLIFLIGIIGNFIPFSLISWSEQYIKSNTAGLLLSVAPIITLILSHFFTKDDKFTLTKFISISVGLIGVLLIFGYNPFNILTTDKNEYFIPKLAIILSAFGYVISAILAYNLKHINTFTLTTYVTIFAAFVSIPFFIYYEISNPSNFNYKTIFPVVYLGIFPTAIAFLIRFHLISKAGPIFLSYVAYLIPIFAIFWGYIFLKETISVNTSLGVMMILIGVYIGRNSNVQNSLIDHK